uniref:Uncharacterized protein n=1 Tax=Nelumbo nucifera TaxID=4432 RepID=A0A822ZH67_NELNU|nr:TPA_asm: hypothetical protein HUJ06_002203 [Nelumbo nucifera]
MAPTWREIIDERSLRAGDHISTYYTDGNGKEQNHHGIFVRHSEVIYFEPRNVGGSSSSSISTPPRHVPHGTPY